METSFLHTRTEMVFIARKDTEYKLNTCTRFFRRHVKATLNYWSMHFLKLLERRIKDRVKHLVWRVFENIVNVSEAATGGVL